MRTSRVTTKGQITIPAATRRQMGIRQGDSIGFISEGEKTIIIPIIKDIESSFGLIKAKKSVSLDDIEQAILHGGSQS